MKAENRNQEVMMVKLDISKCSKGALLHLIGHMYGTVPDIAIAAMLYSDKQKAIIEISDELKTIESTLSKLKSGSRKCEDLTRKGYKLMSKGKKLSSESRFLYETYLKIEAQEDRGQKEDING